LDELPSSSWASAGLCGLRIPREDVEDTHGMSFVFAYEVEPEGRAAFEAVYGPDGERLWRAERVIGRFESV
jgi:hypothetical protein